MSLVEDKHNLAVKSRRRKGEKENGFGGVVWCGGGGGGGGAGGNALYSQKKGKGGCFGVSASMCVCVLLQRESLTLD